MFAKLLRVKGLGLVFADFSWPAATPAFKDVNLVYGWNGCGKTTLTRLFDGIARGDAGGVEYQVELSGGATIQAGEAFPRPIRVFNQPYIEANVRVLESKASSISILLGEENKELLAQIEADQRALNGDPVDPEKKGMLAEFSGYTQKKERKERGNEKNFTDIAKTISAALTGSDAGRSYRSPNAKRDFAALAGPALLPVAALEEKTRSLRQTPLPALEAVGQPMAALPAGGDMGALDLAANIYTTARSMVTTTVEAEVIERLAANPLVAEWVERGLHLHPPGAACEFCGNPVAPERLAQLARHFSDADRALKRELEDRIVGLRLAYGALDKFQPTDAARLYEELRAEYQAASDAFTAERAALLSQIAALGKLLQEKKLRTTEPMAQDVTLDAAPVREALGRMDTCIRAHNEKSGEFARLQGEAVQAIKTHYLSGIFEEVKRREAEIAELNEDLAHRAAEVAEVKARIAANMAQISSEHRACEEINKGLRTFLGRDELRFEPEEKAEGEAAKVVGYRIMRGDAPAEYLSEGEKTAVAFVYFVVHLADGKFSKPDGVVVIDDPISSLDSNSLYQAFSFLKNAVDGCGQVFILTHNFDFLKLLLNWRSRVKGQTGYYMISNTVAGDVRRASVQHMDRELRDYESEYHYLFKRLKEMRADQDGTIMKAYPVANIARKVWETFLYYRVPNGKNPYTKTIALKEQGYDAFKLDAIYKFTNDQSHMTGGGFNPALVPETKKVLDELFDMMKEISPEHFEVLDQATR